MKQPMSENPITIRFPACTILLWNDGTYTETVFADGTKCPAMPDGSEAQSATAHRLGYGDDVAAMCREHEILHTLLALARGKPYSPVLWDVAHGAPDPAPDWHYEEEADVLALQRLIHDDAAEDADGRIARLRAEVDVDAVLSELRRIRARLASAVAAG
jgi:hypothetical protein